MEGPMKRIIVVVSVFLLLCSMIPPLYAADDTPGGGVILVDLVMVRPLGFAALVIGAAASIVATPFALASGSTGKVYDKLVVEPYQFSVCRPLGSGL